MKRLVLVDRTSNRVCGDTSALGPHARNWAAIVAELDDDTAGLAACAARFLDQSLGKTARDISPLRGRSRLRRLSDF